MPQVPEVGVETVREAEQDAVVPPLLPVHDQLHGPEPETEDADPVVQRLIGVDERDWE